MSPYRKRIIKPPHLRSPYTHKPKINKTSRYKLKFYGSFFALIFLLAILYGRSKHYIPSVQQLHKGKIDYSRPDWKKKFGKISPPPSTPDLSDNNKQIKTLVLILKEYRYWEQEVYRARKAGDREKEEYALSNYRQAMEKIARYSDEAIKRAEEELEKSAPSPAEPNRPREK
jgi:hypothetical protein